MACTALPGSARAAGGLIKMALFPAQERRAHMKVRDLIKHWDESAGEPLSAESYTLRLPLEDASRVRALAEMYPRRAVSDIITDLLHTALNEVEASLPYEQGSRVIAEDDQGDPIYEDTGPAARFRQLASRFAEEMREQAQR